MSKNNFVTLNSFRLLLLLAAVPFLFPGCAQKEETPPSLLVLQDPQYPAEIRSEELQPGLAPYYFLELYRNIGQMLKNEELVRKMGKPGPPIAQLNHRFGSGKVFDSGEEKGVGVIMYGYFYLPEPGDYVFQAFTNDGFELYVNSHLLVTDPGVHKGRLSDRGLITIARGGWFPVTIRYFQRKGTAALQLYWQPPGAGEFSIVPREVYGHRPDTAS